MCHICDRGHKNTKSEPQITNKTSVFVQYAWTENLKPSNIRVHVFQKFKCAFKSHFHPVTGHILLKEHSQAADYGTRKPGPLSHCLRLGLVIFFFAARFIFKSLSNQRLKTSSICSITLHWSTADTRPAQDLQKMTNLKKVLVKIFFEIWFLRLTF